MVPTEGSLTPYFWATNEHDVEAFERGVRADPRVEHLERLDNGIDRTLYQIQWAVPPNGILDAFTEHDILVEGAQCSEGIWTFRLRAVDRESLKKFVDDAHEQAISVSLEQIVNNPGTHDSPFGLTPKQYEALQLAFSEGYFEVPRRTSQGELADEVGITRQAFARRLKRALHTLLSAILVKNKLPRRN